MLQPSQEVRHEQIDAIMQTGLWRVGIRILIHMAMSLYVTLKTNCQHGFTKRLIFLWTYNRVYGTHIFYFCAPVAQLDRATDF